MLTTSRSVIEAQVNERRPLRWAATYHISSAVQARFAPMADFPYLNLFTDAFLADTSHLDATETGAYLLLLMAAWRSPECALPDDDARLARMARCETRVWNRIRPTVMAFWTKTESGQWYQKRLTKEREFCSASRNQKKVAAAKRWEAKEQDTIEQCNTGRHQLTQTSATLLEPKSLKENNLAHADACEPHMQPTTHNPQPIKEEEKNSLARVPKAKPTRLPENFDPDQSCHRLADELGMTAEDRGFVFDQFRDYWRSVPGAKGLKLDWQATFRNWMRNEKTRQPMRKPNGTYQQKPSLRDSFAIADAVIDEAIRRRDGIGEERREEDFGGISRLR